MVQAPLKHSMFQPSSSRNGQMNWGVWGIEWKKLLKGILLLLFSHSFTEVQLTCNNLLPCKPHNLVSFDVYVRKPSPQSRQ